AGPDPWRADSLEWATTSPPPEYNFAAVPIVNSRHPLWDQRRLPTMPPGGDDATSSLGVDGALQREVSVTTGLDAWAEGGQRVPEPTALPVVVALGIALF